MLRYLPLIFLAFATSVFAQSTTAPSPAAPALTAAQKQQLATTEDGSAFDQAGLYPLLKNVAQWNPDNPPDGKPLDYNALLKNPAAHRGQIITIHGQFAGLPPGQSPRILLAQSGVWGNAITRWGIVTNLAKDHLVLVAFVDPHDQLKAPPSGHFLTVVGRFYEDWHVVDLANKPVKLPVFVARSPQIEHVSTHSSVNGITIGLVALIVFIVFVFFLRYMRRQGSLATSKERLEAARRRNREDYDEDDEDFDEDDEDELPEDPVQALDELARRNKESEENHEH